MVMDFLQIYFQSLILVLCCMTLLWALSLALKNAGIVDVFWGGGFVLLSGFYLVKAGTWDIRSVLLAGMVTLWGVRLSIHIFIRNYGKGEDFRYANFRRNYGERRYPWISFFQVFMLQGILMWLVSLTLAGVFIHSGKTAFGLADVPGIAVWLTGFIFETVGDAQLSRFRREKQNEGKILQSGLWRYTRHPNYFGDAAVWWGFALLCIATASYWHVAGSLLMTFLIIRISGVAMLEKSLIKNKPDYGAYAQRTSAFFPWFPKKEKQ